MGVQIAEVLGPLGVLSLSCLSTLRKLFEAGTCFKFLLRLGTSDALFPSPNFLLGCKVLRGEERS